MLSQLEKLDALGAQVSAAREAARKGELFTSYAGLALVNAAHDLFECDALYDLADDVRREVGIDREGAKLDRNGDTVVDWVQDVWPSLNPLRSASL